MGTVTRASKPVNPPDKVTQNPDGSISVRHDDGSLLTFRIERPAVTVAPDELLPSTAWGIEAKPAREAIKNRAFPVAKIGRKFYARRSDLLAYFDQLAVEQAATPARKPAATEDAKGLLLRLAGKGAR